MPTLTISHSAPHTGCNDNQTSDERRLHIGFPSPANDFIKEHIDLNHLIVKHPASTFYARVEGSSMKGAGIGDGDLIVIDRSLDAADGDIAVCCLDGKFILRRLRFAAGQHLLLCADPAVIPSLEITAETDFSVWGVVTHTIKSNRRNRKLQ
ncbi:MAG: translesion error-prone DNA polymerase V autoproteolytic subunit [Paramuribaculum sp.]|nr:translesion error-prone DNA polymerase V autoproteolytic subunit [Paramuribaculum sp.]